MLNPYILLAGIVFAIGLFGSGVSIGYKWSERAHGAALAATQDTAIKAANAAAYAETQRTVAAAKAEADARLKASSIKHKGEIDALKKSRAECARDAESVQLLNDAINSANGSETAPDKLPEPVQPAGETGGWLRIFNPSVGVSGSGAVRGVQTPAQ